MSKMLYLLWMSASFALIPVCIMYFVTFKRVMRIVNMLEHERLVSFKNLGFFKNNDIATSNKFIMFLLKKDYEVIDNKELLIMAKRCRALLLLGTLLVVFLFFIPIIIGGLDA